MSTPEPLQTPQRHEYIPADYLAGKSECGYKDCVESMSADVHTKPYELTCSVCRRLVDECECDGPATVRTEIHGVVAQERCRVCGTPFPDELPMGFKCPRCAATASPAQPAPPGQPDAPKLTVPIAASNGTEVVVSGSVLIIRKPNFQQDAMVAVLTHDQAADIVKSLVSAHNIADAAEATVTVEPNELVVKGLTAAYHALRGYQYGNADPTLAEETADYVHNALESYKVECEKAAQVRAAAKGKQDNGELVY